jgi:hypothetical protein
MNNLAAFFIGTIAGIIFMLFFGQRRVIHTDSFVEKQDVGKIKQKGRQNNMKVEPSLFERIFKPDPEKQQSRKEKRQVRRQARKEKRKNDKT